MEIVLNRPRYIITKLLEKAFKKASELSEAEQNVLAKWVLDELESEKKWDKAFAKSEDVLERMADEALSEYKKRKTKPISIQKM